MSQDSLWYRIGRAIGQAVLPGRSGAPKAPTAPAPQPPSGRGTAEQQRGAAYPGDFRGSFEISYAPHEDNVADPGEVVWTWVPYEEDHSKGKDRPVLVVGRDGRWLLAVPLSSKDHDLDARQEASEGRYWVEIGSGGWDSSGRPSSVRVNRILRVDPDGVRRIGARLDRGRFDAVAAGIRKHAG